MLYMELELDIYKICYLKDNKINKIQVFNSITEYGEQNITDLYKNNKNIFDNIFNELELNNVIENSIPVFFMTTTIYIDDTVETIKKKIIKENNISFEELYLFCTCKEILNSYNIYDYLTQNKKFELTKIVFLQFLLNINLTEEKIEKITDKDIYTYNDILELNLDNKDFFVNKSIGQIISSDGNKEFPSLINPYNITEYNPILSRSIDEFITTTNKSLLLSTFINQNKINNNTIYVCEAENTLEKIASLNLSVETAIKMYFPYLIKYEITSIEELLSQTKELRTKSKELINVEFERNNQNVDLFNNVYREKISDLKYNSKGINKIELTIHPKISYNLPLDIVFKLIHATQSIPFIKYNPSKKMENVYRLFTDKISVRGKKIPYLSKSTILKLMKSIGRNKSVSVYIRYEDKTNILPIVCSFHNNATISVSLELETIQNIEYISDILIRAINPIINIVKKI